MDSSRESAEIPGKKVWPITLVLGLAVVAVLAGVIFIFRLTSAPAVEMATETKQNALAGSSDSCVTCHEKSSPGIVHQYGSSSMAAAKVTCRDCHEVKEGLSRFCGT